MILNLWCIYLYCCVFLLCVRVMFILTLLIAGVVISIVSVTQQRPPILLLAAGIEGDCEDVILS